MGDQVIPASRTARLLYVAFDEELRWKDHVQLAVKSATATAVSLSSLRYLRLPQIRQVCQAWVLPRLDYASTVWYIPVRHKAHLHNLATVQRACLLRIVSGFRSVATQALEVEYYVLPTNLRLKRRAQDMVARLHTLPSHHALTKVIARAKRRFACSGSATGMALVEAIRTINSLEALETIDPTPTAPWTPSTLNKITITPNKKQALVEIASMMNVGKTVVYTDASTKD